MAGLPRTIAPMFLALVEQPFSMADWIFQPKLDGYRLLAFRDDRGARLISQRGTDLTSCHPPRGPRSLVVWVMLSLAAMHGRWMLGVSCALAIVIAVLPGTGATVQAQTASPAHHLIIRVPDGGLVRMQVDTGEVTTIPPPEPGVTRYSISADISTYAWFDGPRQGVEG